MLHHRFIAFFSPSRGSHAGKFVRVSAAVLILVRPGFASADFQEGLDAYRRGDFKSAEAQWRGVAAQSRLTSDLQWRSGRARQRADACYALGLLYHQGQGVAQDFVEASKWYREAANEGHPDAQLKLGYLHMTGAGVDRDYDAALRWFEAAARQGSIDAQFNIATIYERGLGRSPDPQAALDWYRRAAAAGDKDAAKMVARMGASSLPVTEPAFLPAGVAWLAAADRDDFTLQLLAANDRRRVEEWAAQHGVDGPSGIFHFTRDGRDWYALLQGVFGSRSEAEAAALAWSGPQEPALDTARRRGGRSDGNYALKTRKNGNVLVQTSLFLFLKLPVSVAVKLKTCGFGSQRL